MKQRTFLRNKKTAPLILRVCLTIGLPAMVAKCRMDFLFQLFMPRKVTRSTRIKPSTNSVKRGNGNSAVPVGRTNGKRHRRNFNRQTVKPSPVVMVALGNPNGLRWILEFAPIYASILQGIELGVRSQSKQMQVCSIRSPEEFQTVVQRRPPDGLLFLGSKNVISLRSFIGSIPCVSVLGAPCDGVFDRITYNQSATGHLPAQRFLELGITSAAILGPSEPGRNTTFGERLTSFCETLEDGGGKAIPLIGDDLYEPGNPSNQPRPSEIAELIKRLKAVKPLPQGLFVMADNFLPAVYQQLTNAGITPGKDLQIISCNAEGPFLAGLTPPPCQVHIPSEEIGRRAVELLEWRAQHPDRPNSTTVLQPSLLIPEECSVCS
jgi:DNA-binding LacI/PurR family transcriptional regulator